MGEPGGRTHFFLTPYGRRGSRERNGLEHSLPLPICQTTLFSSSTTNKADQGAEHAQEAAKDFKSTAQGAAQDLKGRAQDVKGAAQQRASEYKDKAQDIAGQAQQKAEQFAGQAKQKAEEFKGQAQAAFEDAKVKARTFQDDGEAYVRDNPTRAVLTALGVGFFIGLIFRR